MPAVRQTGLADKQRASANEILEAAAQAFAKRGYAATSIDDIADVLGCTKGRIYHYFRTKGDLFFGIHRQALEWALDAVVPVANDDSLPPAEKLHRMVYNHAVHMMDHSDFMGPSQHHVEMTLAGEGRSRQAELAEIFKMRREFEQCFVDVIAAGMATGDFRPGDPDLTAKAVLGAVNWMNVWYRPTDTKKHKDRTRVASEMAEYALFGVTGHK